MNINETLLNRNKKIYKLKRPAAIFAKRPFTRKPKKGSRSYDGDDVQALKLQQAEASARPLLAPIRGGIFRRPRGLEAKTIIRTPGAPSRINLRPESRKRRASIEIKAGQR